MEVYIIWNNSFEYNDICINGDIIYITDNYQLALKEFEKYRELCKDNIDHYKWCYNFTLCSYTLNEIPVKEKCLYKIDNIS